MAVAFGSEAWDTDHDLAIYAIDSGGLRLEWSYKAKDYEIWEFAGWEGDDNVKLRVTSWTVDKNGKRELKARGAPLDERRLAIEKAGVGLPGRYSRRAFNTIAEFSSRRDAVWTPTGPKPAIAGFSSR